MDYQVIKRNGKKEPFKVEKLKRVLAAAGLEETKINQVVTSILSWLKTHSQPEITSLRIRDKVIIELQKTDRQVADFFIWYEKNKDKNGS